ncbi:MULTISPECIES: PQQ-dependent sugar dehydrogenase [unclassified Leptolyngbya]|uniref:PQQ-dependent sugar dehydrogenase n=1 Tax=unclassified Leptolyngbya TaxID=2650499 RepID=UPI001681D45F|nr:MULTISPECIES: PQQ-dependent sugar dehydrogenase [unclassified Leptolyngbya]MBD1909935.1 PQQ-dependent sugar dehydrogenase [Leptolyngbya sp. FACHB-8]MBD2154938.1 PQQ-dependent sugar dehydrogenase [Leptolyngbya sp. FACHB-16]
MIRLSAIASTGRFLALLLLAGCATSTSLPLDTASPEKASPAAVPSASVAPEAAVAQAPARARQVTLFENLEHPWGIDWLPDGTMLVTERPGRLRVIRNGVLEPTPVPGVPEVLAVKQGGLLDVAVHPQFAENQWVYFTYAHGSRNANHTRVARARFDGQALSDWTVIFEVDRAKEDGQHFGSRMAWLPDGTLLVSIGDGGNPPVSLDGELIRHQAQNLDVRLGKIVRLNDDGSAPADNPFVNTANADLVVWSYGHRNIQGLALDPETNQVWATEHGARGGDELNLIEGGKNYGWPVVTFSREYSGGTISSEQSRPGMVDPKLVWTPSKAPSGLMVYRGDRFPQWRGHLFSGGLVTQDIRRIEVDDTGTVINQESISIGQRVREIQQGPDGLIYVLTDAPNGRIIRLEPEA